MMEIQRSSWHYKLYKIGFDRCPPAETSLCNYFWRIVWSIFVIAAGTGVAAVILYVIGHGFYNHTAMTLAILGSLVALIGGIFLFSWARDRSRERRWAADYVAPKPSLLRAYLKAKKDKVCPLITFTYEKK